MTDAAMAGDARARRRMILTLVGIAAAAVVLYVIWQLIAASEEPTIRIKGGSVIIELDQAAWQDAGDMKWRHNGTRSDRQRYQASLATSAGKNCPAISNPITRVVVDSSEAQRQVTLSFQSQRTHVQPAGAGSQMVKDSERVLRLTGGDSQFVRKMTLHSPGSGQAWECEFAEGEFLQLTLCDKKEPCQPKHDM